jgi:glycosyltransferase involved in cell wall biosynthesis
MRVLVLCTDAYGGHGGIALHNRYLIAAIASHPDCEEVVVVPRVIYGPVGPLPEKVTFMQAAAQNKALYAATIMRLVASRRFDAVICGHINLLPFTMLLRVPPILIVHGIEAWRPRHRFASRKRLQHVRAVVSVSQITASRFADWSRLEVPVYITGNAIEVQQYGIRKRNPELVARYGLEGKRVLLTVGRIVAAERYKGFDEVIEVLPDIAAVHPDVVYLVAGGGSDIERLRRKATRLGVGDRVIFTGLFREEEKPDIYALADLYVMPSRGEGFGFVLLEALASGLPVIGSRHDGGREALRHGQLGTLVDPSSRPETQQAILDVLERSAAASERRIPDGIHYFDYAEYERRIHDVIDAEVVR